MSEKLTVAELLARNGRSSSDSSSNRPRRRRRSVEDGGVSVAELTGSIPVVKPEDEAAAATAQPQAPAAEPPQVAYKPAEHQWDDAAQREEKPAESNELAELEASLADDEIIEYEDATISWPMMLLQAIVAIAAGVGVFFGFSLLWNNMSMVVVLLLALAVTLLLVGLVHALLRRKDKLLMLLAFVVGLVLTIGPRLIMGI